MTDVNTSNLNLHSTKFSSNYFASKFIITVIELTQRSLLTFCMNTNIRATQATQLPFSQQEYIHCLTNADLFLCVKFVFVVAKCTEAGYVQVSGVGDKYQRKL